MRVDVVTRTLDRPEFLARAADSVASQTHAQVSWFIVNDGGDADKVEAALNASRAAPQDRRIIHHQAPAGMEAAAVAGIASGENPLVAIHDDDDSWEPRFLEAAVAALQSNPAASGVVLWTNEVQERLRGGEIERLSVRTAAFRPATIHFGNLTLRNQFPPIALVFRRAAYHAVGGADPSIDLLGDWDLALRLLLEGDILVVGEALANYHVRASGSAGANSVVARRTEHENARAALINRYVRSADPSKRTLGLLLAGAASTQEVAMLTSPAARLRRLTSQVRPRRSPY